MYLGIDWGTKKIGLAAGSQIPYEIGTIKNDDQTIAKIKKLCDQEKIGRIVIGMPVFESGDAGTLSSKIEGFGQKLKAETGLKIYFEPENLTTQTALDLLREEGNSPEEIEEKVDQTAARLILEQYIANKDEQSEETL